MAVAVIVVAGTPIAGCARDGSTGSGATAGPAPGSTTAVTTGGPSPSSSPPPGPIPPAPAGTGAPIAPRAADPSTAPGSLPTTALPATTAARASTPTTVTTVTSPTTPTTPEEYAKALVAAWRAGDRVRARQVADQVSVDRLFAMTDADPVALTLIECGGAAGSTICRFAGGGKELLVTVRNPTGGLAPLVTGVRLAGA